MILPETVVRAEIITTKDNVNEVVSKLLKLGTFEPDDPKVPISQNRLEDARRILGEINDKIARLILLMEASEIAVEPKGNLKQDKQDWIETARIYTSEASKIEEKYRVLLEEIQKLKSERDSLKLKLDELEPFKDVDIDLKKMYTNTYFDVALAILSRQQIEELKKRGFEVISYQSNNFYPSLIIGLKGTELNETLKKLGIKRLETQDLVSPSQQYKTIMDRINYIDGVLGAKRKELREKANEDKDWIQSTYGKLLTLRDSMLVLSKAKISDYFIQIEGYVLEKFTKQLTNSLKDSAVVVYEYPKRFGEQEEPPTYVNLPKSIRPLESIIELYGTPSYWEISPTLFLIITFPLIFGLMFPDLGNAIILLIFAIWFHNYGKKRNSESIRYLSLVLIYSSIIAAITGILAREFFGPLAVGGLRELLNNPSYPVGPLYNIWPISESVYEKIAPILPTSGETGIVNTIIISLLLGSILLFVSSILGVINTIKKKDYEYLVLDRLPLLLIYTPPLIVFSYGFTNISNYTLQIQQLLGGIEYFIFHSGSPAPGATQILATSLVIWVELALIFNWIGKIIILRRHEKVSIGNAIVTGFIEGAFEAGILLLSNVISFIRILIFAIAHYYILFAFSFMGYLAAGSPNSLFAVFINPASIAIIIVGNLLAIALEGLVVFIQDMRLHFYEMFSKFYEGRGRKFNPVKAYVELP
ncbi:ATP synthase subunit I [Sulfolobus acidocaldarius SUSAZ]|nr:ATP synthase subunit I [Sulfolobus acidocaldarius SUSAZ]